MAQGIDRIREYLAIHGASYTLRRLTQKGVQRFFGTYDRRRRREQATQEELARQRAHQPPAGLISLVIPVYNTAPSMLEALLQTIRAQTYQNFEALLYDGCSTRPETLEVINGLSEPPFRVIRGERNLGISGNTNEAVALAKGEYIALCDHDDLLAPDALWRVADCIACRQPDMIYTDEDRVTQDGRRYMDPHYKPDYCPDNLVSDNYICHLAVIRKSLFQEVGGLRAGFDGSQDHDLFLRVAEKTGQIIHLPYILYSWRENFSSASHLDLDTCLTNGCRAAVEHEARLGRGAQAVPVNKEIRLWYDVPRLAMIEAIVFGISEEECQSALGELAFRTDWPNLTGTILLVNESDLNPGVSGRTKPVHLAKETASSGFGLDPAIDSRKDTILPEPESGGSANEQENQGSALFRMINEAAASSEAEYLLLLDARITGMNRYFLREMIMYAQRPDVAGVSPILTDRHGRITHAGFALGLDSVAACVNEGMLPRAGGWHDLMNKVHNVGAVSLCCQLLRRENWIPLDDGFRGGLVSVEQALRQRALDRVVVLTPHAQAVLPPTLLLLSGRRRDPADVSRLRNKHPAPLSDPCYSSRFSRKKANYHY